MNRRIRSIFWLMALCIIGINAFQGYWLWTTYHLKSQQFNQTMRDALFSVLQNRQMVEANRLFARQGNEKSLKPTRMIIRQFDGTTNREQIRVIVRQPGPPLSAKRTRRPGKRAVSVGFYQQLSPGPPGTETELFESPDTLAHRISTLLLLDWAEGTRINLAKLADAYRAELFQRGINPTFKLDTVSVQPQKMSKNVLVRQLGAPSRPNDKPNVMNRLVVPINPIRNLFAQVTFETPTFYLLRRMGWLLGGSVFLVLLTTGSFLFMLSTILRQKKLSEVKNDFINNMTHELKTPIATVTAAVEALQHFGALDDPKKTQMYLAISQNNLQRLSDLVEKVLNLAVEEKKELVLNPEWVKPSEIISQAIGNYHPKSDKLVDFEVAVETTDEPVLIDRFHMTNVLNNLIENAIKYSGESVNIRIASQQREHVWRLSVKDNGIGIPRAYQAAIFDRFFRVPTGNLHPVKGFGLGLSYVRQVVEKHGGLAEVISEPGQGSEFTLLVPMQGGTGQVSIRRLRINFNPLQSAS
ncbi:HAMP domain-containing histidine kinase [Spirosoma sp. BT702]|uniref:histidine kinase n=1 Tax=Spirosoma profusum TaxID=2771354 RepID=A0A927AS20_9BACT|nr:HAMP domain-containing sensor histidine kinase [Spirosoma profusum]MBD2700575.1 HAMP domain-containing histidine kinase [Spirosoma profusum]